MSTVNAGGGADILRNYEQQFGILCADITSKISRAAHVSDKKALIQSVEGLFAEAKELIEQMELEIRDSTQKRSAEQREKYMNIINGYKSELKKLENEFNKQLKSQASLAASSGLYDDTPSSSTAREDLELDQLREQNKTSLLNMNKKLDNGYKMILETEETGQNILSDLFGQREQMQRARDRLRESNVNLGKSSRLVSAMSRHVMQNKLILFGICALLVLFVIFVIYLIVKRAI